MTYEIEEPTLWGEATAPSTHIQAGQLQSKPGGPPGYRLRRIILVNFWLYDVQEFEIPHGRLFLSGENASGKSTVLMAAIPLALDGNIRPERIDTFGKREKRIDYYILGSNESATPFIRDQRTSYIALEFEWCGMQTPPFASELRTRWERGEYEQARFLTIGLVFQGNRNSANPVQASRFLLTDGSRLTTTETKQTHERSIPIVKKASSSREIQAVDYRTFRKIVGEHGILCDSAGDYEQKVAQALFNFSNIQDFRRLIRQLLYLRQPNLNSVLSLENVRIFLNQSLPQIPIDILQHAATTLETMDNLREEIERRKKAYQATEQLHRAQETLTLARVRVAACNYVHEHYLQEKEQNNVRRLRSNLTRANNELGRCLERLNTLTEEEMRITGELQALQGSEGLQAAQRLNEVTYKVSRLEAELRQQQELLDDAIANREQRYEQVEQYSTDFQQLLQENLDHLQRITAIAVEQARWELASEQLTTTRTQVQQFSLDAQAPNVDTSISTLLDASLDDRLRWLRTLSGLHRQIEQESRNQQAAQQRESRFYEEMDQATRAFETTREQLIASHQELADILDTIVEESDILTPDSFHMLHERGYRLGSEGLTPQEFIAQFQSLLQEYQASLKASSEQLNKHINQFETQRDQLQQQQGAKGGEVHRAEKAYRKKLEEPEFVPARSAHRIQAREQLAQQQIPALPLYMLLDFTPELDNQSELASRLERILEDAGLLDALVVPPAYTVAADSFLSEQGLSDCRLDIERLLTFNWTETGAAQSETAPLRMDPAIYEHLGEDVGQWENSINSILAAMQRTIFANEQAHAGRWKHGLVMGQAHGEQARCIGKATRVREQQRAQEELRQRWETLRTELQHIDEQVTHVKQRLEQFQNTQAWLSKALQSSDIEQHSLALQMAYQTLKGAQERYQEAGNETREIRQRILNARTSLQKESSSNGLFATDAASVERAQDACHQLRSDYQTLHNRLSNMLRVWRAHRQAREDFERAKSSEFRTSHVYNEKERVVKIAQNELTTLQNLVRETSGTDMNTLIERLQALEARHTALPQEKKKEEETKAKQEIAIEYTQDELRSALESFEKVQRHCDEARENLVTALQSYPIEQLAVALRNLEERNTVDIAQEFLEPPLSIDEEEYSMRKKTLESEENTTYDALYATFSQVSNLLHDYGPSLVNRGNIVFINADRANSFTLLTRLGEEITRQESLLDEKEQELFKDFLLKEMADTIRQHILEAESWIDRLNTMLARTAIIEERYHLRWVSKEPEPGQAGSYLSQHHALLRRQKQAFLEEETETLVYAFRQEVADIRARLREGNGTTFVEALAEIFDYRQWFHFEITIIQTDGQRQHLTDRLLKKRSGAEQYVALYVPFFAALSALYESAGEGAPRLIALDEAFDKVSASNTQKLLKFLTAQNFQWIMSGPRLSGEGTEIPACVRYLMLHQKGTELATGIPSFWSQHQLTREHHNGREDGEE